MRPKTRYFYPRSPCGERPCAPVWVSVTIVFLSTLSLRRATIRSHQACARKRDFYPRSPCGERPAPVPCGPHADISIHALLAESDANIYETVNRNRISIHALLAESDLLGTPDTWAEPVFLSTLSLRRATLARIPAKANRVYFYPRSPCGERRTWIASTPRVKSISIHALLAESDPLKNAITAAPQQISIHALLAESDEHTYQLVLWVLRFLSTLSLRRATT